MKAEDLRYKNYITYKGKVFQVNDIFGASGLINVLPNGEDSRPGRLAVNDKDYAPIPLSEEWLIRFGFEKINHIYDGVIYKKEWLRFSNGVADWRGGYIKQKPEYVHQLQNLYYALTGSELTVTN